MKNLRLACAGAVVLLLLVSAGANVLYNGTLSGEHKNSYDLPLAAAPHEDDPLAAIDPETFIVGESFASHLPVVVIDTQGVEPPITTMWDMDKMVYVPIKEMEPYVKGSISIYDSPEGLNSPFGEASVTSSMDIKRRGNTSMLFEKAQWLVKLTTSSGQNNDLDLLGMGADNEWVLNGTMSDKSMLRNYLAYRTASQILPYTPDSRYCEVLVRTADGYRYEGVYLLAESIKQGVDRVNIEPYSSREVFNSYVVRRDREDVEGNMLDTYGRLQGHYPEYIGLIYPSKYNVTEQMTRYVQADINAIEQVIYSDDFDVFRQYADVIDVNSFIDYYLINEYFISYDAGNFSTYMYKDLGGKLSIGPVWDFDGTMDNYVSEPANPDAMAFYLKPWFDRLCKDDEFVRRLERRYAELARGILSTESVVGEIDNIVFYLGGAQQREWLRWAKYHTMTWETDKMTRSIDDYLTDDGLLLHRNATTYEQEIYRIKVVLRDHSSHLPSLLRDLRDDAKWDTGLTSWMWALLLVATLAIFIPAIFVAFRK